jgi:hypothetical protein
MSRALMGRPGAVETGRARRVDLARKQLERLNRQINRATNPDEPWHCRVKAARSAAGYAERLGVIRRPRACEACGRAHPQLERHHPHHERPLVVWFLCPACHRKADRVA